MTRRKLIQMIDQARLTEAIQKAEHRTSGEICVSVARLFWGSIDEKVGQEFWDRVVAVVSDKFREGDFTEGLVRGIEEVGEQLATHFPHEADDKNELSDEIDFGGI